MPAKQKSPPLRDAETGKIVRRREAAPPGADGYLLTLRYTFRLASALMAAGVKWFTPLPGGGFRHRRNTYKTHPSKAHLTPPQPADPTAEKVKNTVVAPRMIPGFEVLGDQERVFFRQDIRRAVFADGTALKVWHFCGHPADLGFPDGRMHPAGGHLEQFQIKLEYCGGFLDGIGRRKPAAVQFREFLLNGRKIIVHSIQHRRRKSPLSFPIRENGFLPSQVGFCLVWVSFGLCFSLRYVCIVPHTVGSTLAMRPHPVGISCHSMPQRLRAFSRFCSHLR